MTAAEAPTLARTLGVFQLWGIAVGLVISGEYFGWSFGWVQAGTLGFLVTTIRVAIMYIAFIFSFTELTTAIPQAGGPFAYAHRAFGPVGGAIAGFATLIEFLFAPPAIALAIGAYLSGAVPRARSQDRGGRRLSPLRRAQHRRRAASRRPSSWWSRCSRWRELLVFMGVVRRPSHGAASRRAAGRDPRPSASAIGGIVAAIPFAIWFFLAIEGVAMAAEEAREPRRTIPIAYIGGILTLTCSAFGVMILAGGAGDWRRWPRQRSAAAGDEDGGRPVERLAAHAGVARAVRARRLLPRDHHGLCAADLRAGPRRLSARGAGAAASALPHAACRDDRGRDGRHRGDLQRQPGHASPASR